MSFIEEILNKYYHIKSVSLQHEIDNLWAFKNKKKLKISDYKHTRQDYENNKGNNLLRHKLKRRFLNFAEPVTRK